MGVYVQEIIGPFYAVLEISLEHRGTYYGDDPVRTPVLDGTTIAYDIGMLKDNGGNETVERLQERCPLEYDIDHIGILEALGLGECHRYSDEIDWLFRQGWHPGQRILIRYYYHVGYTPSNPYGPEEWNTYIEWEEIGSFNESFVGFTDMRHWMMNELELSEYCKQIEGSEYAVAKFGGCS